MYPARHDASMAMPSGAGRILVCEDNQATAGGWALVLEDAGYRVVGPAASAEEALEAAYRDPPDLALVDIGLGGLIDGLSVAAELAPLGVAVVLVTGDYRRASTEGRELAADILIKPVRPSTLLASVSSVLRRRAAAG